MKNLGKILLLLLTLSTLSFANVSAKVNQTQIAKGEQLTITLEAQGSKVEFPSNETIEKALGYPIQNDGVSTQTFFSFSSNAGSSKEVKKSMRFSFYPNKSMQVPAFNIKVDDQIIKTNPIKIEVGATQSSTISNEFFKAVITASKKEAMVGEPIDIVMKFYRRVDQNIMKLQYNKPIFSNFEVKDKGEEQPTREGNYVVQRLKYTIYPKKDGNLTIDPAVVKIATPKERRQDPRDLFGAMFMESKWNKVVSNKLSINVKPIPEGATLIGKFDIQVSIDKQEVKANKPIQLKVLISGIGTLESLEEIEYKLDGVTCFSDDADINSKVGRDGTIKSSYKKSFVFLSENDFVIPKHEIKFYNTATQKIDKLIIPEYKIKVKGSQKKEAPSVVTNTPTEPIEIKTATPIPTQPIQIKESNNPLWILLAFIAGILLTLVVIYFIPKIKLMKMDKLFSDDELFKTLYSNMDKDPRIEQIVRDLRAKKQGDKSVVIDKKEIKKILEGIKQ